jgi:hypothetical protein
MHHYGYNVLDTSFLYTIPHEAYAMAATAVSLLVASWKNANTRLLQLRYRLMVISRGGLRLHLGFHPQNFRRHYLTIGTDMVRTFIEDPTVARQREARIRAVIKT